MQEFVELRGAILLKVTNTLRLIHLNCSTPRVVMTVVAI